MGKTLEQRTENYMFTSADANDARLVELKRLVEGTGYRTKRVGRTPKPGQKWRAGWLPLFAAQKFDVYLYPTDKGRVENFKLETYTDWVTLKAMEKVLFETFRDVVNGVI
jgi:hypothetical protein